MSDKPIIAVVGATGTQGGSVIRAILEDPTHPFAARAITRHPDGDKARELARMGAEVVQADTDDRASLVRAFRGAHGAYLVTNYWEHMSPERETAQGTNLAHAARDAGIRHAIWSTFEDTRHWIPLTDMRMPTLMGRYKVPHFDAKAEVNPLFQQLGVPATLLFTSFYWDNMINFGMAPAPGPDGVLALTLPMGNRKLPGIAAGDIGRCAYGIFTRGEAMTGRTIGIAGDQLTGTEMAAELSRALNQEVHYNALSPDAYRALGFPGADDLGNMFQFKADFNDYYCGIRSIPATRDLYPGLLSFRAWLEQRAGEIPVTPAP